MKLPMTLNYGGRCVVPVLLMIVVSIIGCTDPNRKWCEDLRNVAESESKVLYLTEWINKKLENPKFLEMMGWLGSKSMLENPAQMQRLQIDWAYLGLDLRYSSIELVREFGDRDNYLDPSTVRSFRLGMGRNSIFIVLNDSGDIEAEVLPDLMSNLSRISEDVFLYCD